MILTGNRFNDVLSSSSKPHVIVAQFDLHKKVCTYNNCIHTHNHTHTHNCIYIYIRTHNIMDLSGNTVSLHPIFNIGWSSFSQSTDHRIGLYGIHRYTPLRFSHATANTQHTWQMDVHGFSCYDMLWSHPPLNTSNNYPNWRQWVPNMCNVPHPNMLSMGDQTF